MRGKIFNGENKYIYGYEGSKAVPARPSGKRSLKRKQEFGSEKGTEMKSGIRKYVEQGPTAIDFKPKLIQMIQKYSVRI
jgi:hypothetical protein